MEGLAPSLKLLLTVKRSIERGEPLKKGVHFYLSQKNDKEFKTQVQNWLLCIEQGKNPDVAYSSIKNVTRKSLLQILQKGIEGHSIYPILQQIELEITEQCETELEEHVIKLPFKLMIPLLLFQFPALLILLFGPLIEQLLFSLGGSK